jgi:hypothetical protein
MGFNEAINVLGDVSREEPVDLIGGETNSPVDDMKSLSQPLSSGGNPPVDNSHSHSSSSKKSANGFASILGKAAKSGFGFMGKSEVNNFSNLTDPSSVDRSGRTVLPGGRPETDLNVPTSPAPELGQNPIPVPNAGVDETGVNSLY